jgi:spoIIIJ-associated protein
MRNDGRPPIRKSPPRRPDSRSDSRHDSRPAAQRPAPPPLDFQHVAGQLKTYVETAIREMGLALEWEIAIETLSQPDEKGVVVGFRGSDEALLLENNAELLLALEYIAHRWLRLDPRQHDGVRFDCGGYRAERLDELKLSARVAAQRVRETGEVFRFNPMSSRERRLIHLELAGAAGVRTASEGSGDRRQLVIYPAGKEVKHPFRDT